MPPLLLSTASLKAQQQQPVRAASVAGAPSSPAAGQVPMLALPVQPPVQPTRPAYIIAPAGPLADPSCLTTPHGTVLPLPAALRPQATLEKSGLNLVATRSAPPLL